MAGVVVVRRRPEEEEASIRRCSVRSSNGWHQLMQRKTMKRTDAVLGGGGHDGRGRTRWPAMRAHDNGGERCRWCGSGDGDEGKGNEEGSARISA